MKRKRMIKLLMSVGFDRNNAAKAANFCDGSTSHDELYHELQSPLILCGRCSTSIHTRMSM